MSRDEQERLYEEYVLRHFEEPFHRGTLAAATHRFRMDNPMCGDSVQIELLIDDSGTIQQAYFTGSGCVISQAAASMLVEHLHGKSRDVMRTWGAQDMLALFRAPLTPRRRQCCLLAWQALQSALEAPQR